MLAGFKSLSDGTGDRDEVASMTGEKLRSICSAKSYLPKKWHGIGIYIPQSSNSKCRKKTLIVLWKITLQRCT
jgi:hypothetical protein